MMFSVPIRAQINAERMMEVGRNALYFDDYALSIQYFNRVINAKPWLCEPYFYRGLAKFYLEDFLGAETDCSRAIEANPYYQESWPLRALARINLGQYAGAASDYGIALSNTPEDRSLWHNYLLCLIEMDSLAQADSVAQDFRHKFPRQADPWLLHAQVLLAKTDTTAAELAVDTALSVDSYSIDALSIKAQMEMHNERYAEADSFFTEALRIQPRHNRNLISRALARYHQGNLRGAMNDYDAALDLDPTNFVAHYNRGLLRTQVGEDNAAIEDFDFILRIDSTDVMAIYNRAELRLSTGDYRGAVADYTTLIHQYPNFLQGYIQRAQARRRMGDTRGAQRDENHVLREQIAHRYGITTTASRQGAATRKKSEIDLSQYQRLVVDDENEEPTYNSVTRGKIQNQTASTSLEPPLALPDFQRAALGQQAENYDHALESLILKEYEAAVTAFTTFINQHTTVAEAYYNRAYASVQLKHYDEALTDLQRAIDLRPDLGLAYFNRAIILILLQKPQEATPLLSRAGELGIYRAYSLMKQYSTKK